MSASSKLGSELATSTPPRAESLSSVTRPDEAPALLAIDTARKVAVDKLGEPLLRIIDIREFGSACPAPPRFVVADIIPRRHVTLLSAHGGAGKTMLALTIAAHVAAGQPFASFNVEQGRVVFVSLEDSADLLLYRLSKIITAYNLDPLVIAQNLRILEGVSSDASLAIEYSKYGERHLKETASLKQLRDLAVGTALVVVDNASDGFEANANDPHLVRTFVRRMLGGIAARNDAGVLLLTHVDKVSARFGSRGNSYIGTTAWHNSARSRLALVEANGTLWLEHEKANLCKRADPVALRWNCDGVLMPAIAPDELDLEACAQLGAADAEAVLNAFRAAAAAGASVPTARTGPSTAQNTLSTLRELPKHLHGHQGRTRFWHAVARLLDEQRVGYEEYQDNHRHRRKRFVVIDASVPARVSSPIPPAALTRGVARPAPVCSSSETDAELAQTGASPAEKKVNEQNEVIEL